MNLITIKEIEKGGIREKEFINGFLCVVFYNNTNNSYSYENIDPDLYIDNEFELILR